MALSWENTEERKYEVRSTKYEVKELGTAHLRKGRWRMQSRNDARKPNPRNHKVDTSPVRRACVTRVGISIVVFLENFIGRGVRLCSVHVNTSVGTVLPPTRKCRFRTLCYARV